MLFNMVGRSIESYCGVVECYCYCNDTLTSFSFIHVIGISRIFSRLL